MRGGGEGGGRGETGWVTLAYAENKIMCTSDRERQGRRSGWLDMCQRILAHVFKCQLVSKKEKHHIYSFFTFLGVSQFGSSVIRCALADIIIQIRGKQTSC